MERPLLEMLVRAAIDLLRTSEKTDEDISAELFIGNGIGEDEAGALVTLVPLAFCRAWLAGSGVAFAETYFVSKRQGGEAERLLADNAVFVEAERQARQRISQGMSGDDLLAIVRRSAEFRAINKALQDGAQLQDLRFTPPRVYID